METLKARSEGTYAGEFWSADFQSHLTVEESILNQLKDVARGGQGKFFGNQGIFFGD